jgi:hypothetical protein
VENFRLLVWPRQHAMAYSNQEIRGSAGTYLKREGPGITRAEVKRPVE